MRYLLTARVKPKRRAALLRAVGDGCPGRGSIAERDCLRDAAVLVAAGILVAALGASPAGAQPEQEVHRQEFEAVSDEVFDLMTLFYDFDVDLPLNARVVETWSENAVTFEKVVFTTSHGERVPMIVAVPGELEDAAPATILLHGLGNDRRRWWEEDRRPLPDGLLAAGVAVAALDLRFHGERSAENDYQSPVFLTFGNTLFVRNRNMMIQSAIDVRRALDYLADRPDIDGRRIGVAGYSMGGMISILLGALEPDLAAIVASAVPTTDQPTPIDPFHFAPRSEVPTLLQIGRADWLSSPADAEKLRDLLAADDTTLRLFEAGHQLPPEFATEAKDWLLERLQPNAASEKVPPVCRETPRPDRV